MRAEPVVPDHDHQWQDTGFADLEDCAVEGCEATRPVPRAGDDDFDLGDCPYFARWRGVPGHDPEATCGYGCVDEPECVTCEPNDGWPSLVRSGDYER